MFRHRTNPRANQHVLRYCARTRVYIDTYGVVYGLPITILFVPGFLERRLSNSGWLFVVVFFSYFFVHPARTYDIRLLSAQRVVSVRFELRDKSRVLFFVLRPWRCDRPFRVIHLRFRFDDRTVYVRHGVLASFVRRLLFYVFLSPPRLNIKRTLDPIRFKVSRCFTV